MNSTLLQNKATQKTTLALILGNCVPIIGVYFLGWDVLQMVIVYWFESAIIGLFTLCLLGLKPLSPDVPPLAKPLLMIFFLIHFGGFMAGHLLFISLLFGHNNTTNLFTQIAPLLLSIPGLGWTLLSLVLSHGYSFLTHTIATKQYQVPYDQTTMESVTAKPYKRIFVMHFAVILSAFAIMWLRMPQSAVIVLVVVKTIFDVRGHAIEHA